VQRNDVMHLADLLIFWHQFFTR